MSSSLNITQRAVAEDHGVELEYAALVRVTMPKFGEQVVGDLMPDIREVVMRVAGTMDFGWDPTSVYEGVDDHGQPLQSFILVCQDVDTHRIMNYLRGLSKLYRVEILG